MIPRFTEDEIIAIAVAGANASTAYTRAPGTVLRHRASIEAMVAKAYELRPLSDQLTRTNHALAEELAQWKAQAKAETSRAAANQNALDYAAVYAALRGNRLKEQVEHLQRELATTTELLESSRKQEEGTSAIVQSLRDRNASLERSSQALLASKDEKEKMVNSCLVIIAELKQRIESAERGGISDASFIEAIERGEFEAWAGRSYNIDRGVKDAYLSQNTACAWTAWKAARTKAPRPEPKPTPEEIEWREFEKWVNGAGYSYKPGSALSLMFIVWKAARAK